MKTLSVACATLLAITSLAASAAAQDISRLGQDLTPMGAERAGNAAGTIPAWEGGITKPPSTVTYQAGDHHPDPFAADAILFTIDASNADQYADHLTAGQQAMIAAYPDSYRLNVYPSRRSCAYPEMVYAAARENAETARLDNNGNNVVNARIASPFPLPESPVEVIWNHILSYRGYKLTQQEASAVPTASGDFTLSINADSRIILWGNPVLDDIAELDNVESKWLRMFLAPSKAAGGGFLFFNTIDQSKELRRGWIYNTQNRRVTRASKSAYDSPMPTADGLRVSDNQFMYNGAPDKYDWTLVGKREIYIPYNAYKLSSSDLQYSDIIKAKHLNPGVLRHELHRVWVVDGTLKAGESHIFGRRTLYFDEDTWTIVATDLYDREGKEIIRVQDGFLKNYYEVPLCVLDVEVIYDLPSQRYHVQGLKNQEPMPNYSADELDEEDFTPAGLRRAVAR